MLALSPHFLAVGLQMVVGLAVNINPLDFIDGTVASAAEVQEVPERHVRDERGKSYSHDDITHRPNVEVEQPSHGYSLTLHSSRQPFIETSPTPDGCGTIRVFTHDPTEILSRTRPGISQRLNPTEIPARGKPHIRMRAQKH
jgi:hypothetical protein